MLEIKQINKSILKLSVLKKIKINIIKVKVMKLDILETHNLKYIINTWN